jgi:hypothetical protein
MNTLWSCACVLALLVLSVAVLSCTYVRGDQVARCAPDRLPSDCTIGLLMVPEGIVHAAENPCRVSVSAGVRCRVVHSSLYESSGWKPDLLVIEMAGSIPRWDSCIVDAINAALQIDKCRLNNTVFCLET